MTAVQIPEPVASFITAMNRHGHEAFLDAFAEDPLVDGWGTEYHGLAAIKEWSDRELLGADGTFTPSVVRQDGTAIEVGGDWRSSFANGPSLFRFVVRNEKIVSMTIREL